MSPPSDAELVIAARSGDRDAFGVLAQRHHPRLLRTCQRVLDDRGAAAELAQEAVLQALTSLPSLREESAFGPWLCGIGLNLSRRANRRPAVVPLDTVAEPSAPAAHEPGDSSRVIAAIASLPPGQRQATTLFYLADLSHAQISARLGIPVGAVKTRLHKARTSLRARLADLAKEPPAMTSGADPVRMNVTDVRETGEDEPSASHLVLLEEAGGERRLPIWIGAPEATAIALRLEGVDTVRPGTYELTGELLRASGAALEEIRIVRLADMVFYAECVLAGGATVDARPSDALNLALISGAPIHVAEAVLADATEGERAFAEELAAALGSDRDARAIAAGSRRRR